MTLKGKKPHFNVKLLAGYGVAIRLQGNKVILKDGADILSGKSDVEEWFVTSLPYEKIVVSGRGYVSTEAIKLLCENNKNLILTDTFGKPVAFVNSAMESMTGTTYRIAQYDAFRDEKKCQKLVSWIVKEKAASQLRLLEMIIPELEDEVRVAFEHADISRPHKTEVKLGRLYFREYTKVIPSKYGFESRNQSSLRITKRRASDVINAMLNYGYTVLAGEISKFVCGAGLDPYYGFNHKQHTGFQPLVYDLIEPFRWMVDYSVYKMANSDSKNRIYARDYTWTKDGSVVLDSRLIKRFLELLERTFRQERPYKFKHGRKMKNGLSMCQEITIAKIFVDKLIEFSKDKKTTFAIIN